MSYFPSGFWSRLISRILADDSIIDIIRSFFILPKEVILYLFYYIVLTINIILGSTRYRVS